MHFHLLRALNLSVDLVRGGVELGAHPNTAELIKNSAGELDERFFIADRQDSHLFRSQPERKVAGIMFNQKTDESLVRAQRRAMNAERRRLGIVARPIHQPEPFRHGEVDLVGGNGELAPDRAPHLHIDLRSVEGGFIGHLDIIDAAALQNPTHHRFGPQPEFRLIDKFLTELRRVVGRKAHEIFVDPENLKILEIHRVDRIELGFELFLGAIDMRVVHLH